jgi:hypothetical protein
MLKALSLRFVPSALARVEDLPQGQLFNAIAC